MIRIRISAADLHQVMEDGPDVKIRYAAGVFSVELRVAVFQIKLNAHLDLADGRVRACLPFREMQTQRTGGLLGALTGSIWPKIVEPRLEQMIADKLVRFGLPWDLVWVDTVSHPELGQMGTVNLSPRILNEWLRKQPGIGELAPRMVLLEAEPEALVVGLRLVHRSEAAPVWSGGDVT